MSKTAAANDSEVHRGSIIQNFEQPAQVTAPPLSSRNAPTANAGYVNHGSGSACPTCTSATSAAQGPSFMRRIIFGQVRPPSVPRSPHPFSDLWKQFHGAKSRVAAGPHRGANSTLISELLPPRLTRFTRRSLLVRRPRIGASRHPSLDLCLNFVNNWLNRISFAPI